MIGVFGKEEARYLTGKGKIRMGKITLFQMLTKNLEGKLGSSGIPTIQVRPGHITTIVNDIK